jgi:hypothetical protein
VHDRTVNGETFVFGNQGGLFMNAMTWWDHKTESVWSQPWGRAIAGPLKGTELRLLPSELVPWKTWREMHPDTLALALGERRLARATPHDRFVIGVTLDRWATAFPYDLAADAGLVNDQVGPYPLVVHVNADSRAIHVYLRQVDERTLTFVQKDDTVQDEETGSTWQMERGIAVAGPLQGQALRGVPYIPAFDSAWRDFYPDSVWYVGE